MISSSAALRFWAQWVPLPVAISSASADLRASASDLRMMPRTVERAAADFGESCPSAAAMSSRIASAVFRWNDAFLGRSSASATGIACLLQLVNQVERLARGEFVGTQLIEHRIKRINFRLFWRRCSRKQRQIV